MNLKKVLDSGSVIRYHATLIDKKQDTAQHQFGVTLILTAIYPKCSKELMLYALTHDAAEIITGDIPAPVKRANPSIKKAFDALEKQHREGALQLSSSPFSDKDRLAIKWADVLEGIYFTSRRVLSGDAQAIPIRDRWVEYAGSLKFLNTKALIALEELKCL